MNPGSGAGEGGTGTAGGTGGWRIGGAIKPGTIPPEVPGEGGSCAQRSVWHGKHCRQTKRHATMRQPRGSIILLWDFIAVKERGEQSRRQGAYGPRITPIGFTKVMVGGV